MSGPMENCVLFCPIKKVIKGSRRNVLKADIIQNHVVLRPKFRFHFLNSLHFEAIVTLPLIFKSKPQYLPFFKQGATN